MLGVNFEVGESSNSRSTTQTSHPSTHVHLSEEEMVAPQDKFSLYCRLMELYNFLLHRAKENPTFLNRCLDYQIKAKHKRIKMRVSLSLRIDETETVFPLYICLARGSPNNRDEEYSAHYRISRIFKFQDSPKIDGDIEVQAKFKLPEINKLAEEAKSGSLCILVFTNVKNRNSSSEANGNPVPSDESIAGELCLCGKASLEFLYCAWDCSPSFVSGQRAEMVTTIDLIPCFLKCVEKDQSISVQAPCNSYYETTLKKLQILVSAEEYGAKERSPYFTYSSRDILSPSLARLIRLRERNVLFNYRYCNNTLKKTEVTEDFTCSLCLVRCGSYKGLRYHMDSSHGLFDFEFSADQAVNVSIKPDVLEIVGDANPRQEIFMFRAKPVKRRNPAPMRGIPKNLSMENSNDADPTNPESECLAEDGVDDFSEKSDDILLVELVHGTPIMQHVANNEKLSVKSGNETHAVQQFAEKSKLLIELDHEPHVAEQIEKKGNLPVESSHETLAKQQVPNKEKLPVETSHENPTEQQVAKKGRLLIEPDHRTPTMQTDSKKENLSVESHHQNHVVQQVAKKVKLSDELGDEILDVQHVTKKRKLPVEQQLPNKEMLPGEPSRKTSAVQKVAKKGNLSIEPDQGITLALQQFSKKGELPIEAGNENLEAHKIAKKEKLPVKSSQGARAMQKVTKKGKFSEEPNDESPPIQLVFKEGKLPVEHSHPQSNALLCRRQFHHSTKYQPMSLEEVLSGHDSEDEIDDDTKDIEHRKMIDECEDMTKDEREIIFMWSSFVRRQRVVADCHIPWACEAFTKLHAPVLVQSPQLALCWRLLMIKLWNHNLIDGEVMNACSIILEEYQKQNSDPPS